MTLSNQSATKNSPDHGECRTNAPTTPTDTSRKTPNADDAATRLMVSEITQTIPSQIKTNAKAGVNDVTTAVSKTAPASSFVSAAPEGRAPTLTNIRIIHGNAA